MWRYCFRYGLEQIIFSGWWTLTQFIQELSFPITIFRSLSIYYHSSKRVLSTLTLVKEPLHFLWFLRLEQQLAHGILEVVGSQRTRNKCFHTTTTLQCRTPTQNSSSRLVTSFCGSLVPGGQCGHLRRNSPQPVRRSHA